MQLEALIPAGAAADERSQHDELELEPVAIAETGRETVARQVVSTAVRKLVKAGAISSVEADAARLLRHDHDMAYCKSSSPLASLQPDSWPRVDGGVYDPSFSMMQKVEHGSRYGRALRHLGSELALVAIALVIEKPNLIGGSYRDVGRSMIYGSPAPEHNGAGKGALVIVCRELAVFYKLKRPRWSL